MKTITSEMLVAKARENGKELTMKQAEEMVAKRVSLNDDELNSISGGNFIDDFIDIYNDAAERDTKCKYEWDNARQCWHGEHIWEKPEKPDPAGSLVMTGLMLR